MSHLTFLADWLTELADEIQQPSKAEALVKAANDIGWIRLERLQIPAADNKVEALLEAEVGKAAVVGWKGEMLRKLGIECFASPTAVVGAAKPAKQHSTERKSFRFRWMPMSRNGTARHVHAQSLHV